MKKKALLVLGLILAAAMAAVMHGCGKSGGFPSSVTIMGGSS